MRYLCEGCFNPIPAGEAVLRSVMFQRVAWHKDCFETRNEPVEETVVEAAA